MYLMKTTWTSFNHSLKVLSLNHNDSASPNAFPLNLLPNKNISVDQGHGGVNATFNVFVIFSPFFSPSFSIIWGCLPVLLAKAK